MEKLMTFGNIKNCIKVSDAIEQPIKVQRKKMIKIKKLPPNVKYTSASRCA